MKLKVKYVKRVIVNHHFRYYSLNKHHYIKKGIYRGLRHREITLNHPYNLNARRIRAIKKKGLFSKKKGIWSKPGYYPGGVKVRSFTLVKDLDVVAAGGIINGLNLAKVLPKLSKMKFKRGCKRSLRIVSSRVLKSDGRLEHDKRVDFEIGIDKGARREKLLERLEKRFTTQCKAFNWKTYRSEKLRRKMRGDSIKSLKVDIILEEACIK